MERGERLLLPPPPCGHPWWGRVVIVDGGEIHSPSLIMEENLCIEISRFSQKFPSQILNPFSSVAQHCCDQYVWFNIFSPVKLFCQFEL